MVGIKERSQVVPNIYQGYYSDGNRDIVKRADEYYQQNLSPWQEFLWQAQIDRKVYIGDQRFLSQYTALSYEHQKFIFNVSMPVVNMVTGRQRQHRKASQILPTKNSSSRTASQATTVLQHCYDHDNTYNNFSLAFEEGAGITGLALLHSYMDYRRDPICGDFATEVLTADQIMMDAFWKDMRLRDCLFIRTRKYLSKVMVKEMLPGREKDIDLLNDNAYFDTKFTYMPQQYNIRRKGVIAYDEFWYLDKRRQKFMVDPETYESIEIEDDDESIAYIRQLYPDVVITTEWVPTVKLAIFLNNICFYDGPNPLGIDTYSFTPFVGYHDTGNNNYAYRYQGIIRNIRDANYLYNYRKQLEMDLLAAQFSGVDVEEDSLIDDNDAFKVGPGKVRFFKKGRLAALVDKPGGHLDPVNVEITRLLKEDVQNNAGVTPELLGQAQDSDIGITEQLRQGAALTTLQKLFDYCDLSQTIASEVHWAMIQKNYTYGKIRAILGEEPTEEFKSKNFQKYNCVVTNAPLTATTKQLSFLQKYRLWKDGLPIPPDQLLEDLTIQDKDKLVASIQQAQQQQQQIQMQQAQLQMENQKIVNESLKSKAISDRALGLERESRVHLEQAQVIEKLAQAQKQRDESTLAKLKTAKEIESMRVTDIEKIVTLIHNIQTKDVSDSAQLAAQSAQAMAREESKAMKSNQKTGS